MIYIIESGEYSDYQYHAILEGPDGIDFTDDEIREIMEAARAAELEKYPGREPYVAESEWVPLFIKALESKGCREVSTTAFHVGDRCWPLNAR